MDIASITAAPRDVEIKHPATGAPLGLVISLLPESDPKVRSVRRKWMNERLQRAGQKLSAEKLEQQQLMVICAAVCGWNWGGDVTFNGEKPEFNEKNLRAVLSDPRMSWLKDQLDTELGDDAAFFQGSEQN